MNFTTTSFLLAGAAAAIVPIVIHLLSKGKPKKIVFPAIQFASARISTTKRRFTLKRLLLLSLRVLTFLLLGLILSRPYFAPKTARKTLAESAQAQVQNDAPPQAESTATSDPNADADKPASATSPETAGIAGRDVPIATAIVIDDSARMNRVKENAPLFDRAIATARTILDQTSKGSEIAILDGSYDGDAFLPDRYAAKTRLDKLTIQPSGRSVAQSTLEAIALVQRSELPAKEIFVITDSTRVGWAERDVRKITRQLDPEQVGPNAAAPTLYFVDLGDEDYRDAAIVDLALSAETVSQDASLRVDVEVERYAASAGDVELELVFFDAKKLPSDLTSPKIFNDKELILRREKQTLSFGEGKTRRSVNFQASDLPLGSCVGAARIIGSDALSDDDARWFVVDVVSDWRLLVVAPEPIEESSIFLTQALAPEELRRIGRAPFELDVVPYAVKNKKNAKSVSGAPIDLASATADQLNKYRAVFLLDPPGLEAATIKNLTSFVEVGGGLGVFLGRNAAPVAAFQTEEAIKLLGCKPTTQVKAPNFDRQLSPVDYNAPLLASFRQFANLGVPWDALPIAKYWKLEELGADASVAANFTSIGANANAQDAQAQNKAPGLVENRLGRGLVATLATPISDPTGSGAWNAIATGDAAWVFVVFADSVARRLASSSSSILNYATNETATLRSPLKVFPGTAAIVKPDGEEISTPTDVERRQIRFPGTKLPGVYRVHTTPNKDGETIDAAFAANVDPKQFDMTRFPEEEWNKLWEGVPYKKLDLKATGKALDAARRGKESDPYAALALLLAAIFIAETWIANRFYK